MGKTFNNRGQSLVEVLVAATVSAILVAAAVTLIAPVVRSNSYTSRLQVGSALGEELLENVRTVANNNWSSIANLATGPDNTYYIDTSVNPFAVSSVEEVELVTSNEVEYTRYFYVEEVYRDDETNGNIVDSPTGNHLDPSTRKVTVVYFWPNSKVNTLTNYVVRSNNQTYLQTNWADGGGYADTVVSEPFGGFSDSLNINFDESAGSIMLDL